MIRTLLLFLPFLLSAQESLNDTVAKLDSALFQAYSDCNLEKFASFFSEGVEFYHDQGGVTEGRDALVESLRKNICGKTRRELVPGTMQVYPMRNFGAVQIGSHRFYPPAKDSAPTGEAKFIHLWKNTNGDWKITRVISFDHAPLR